MHETYQTTWHEQGTDIKTCWDDLPPSENLPPLRYSETDTDGWEDFNVPVLYFYGGMLPYAGQCVLFLAYRHYHVPSSSHSIRDLLQWPLALPSDGLMDVSVQETTSPLSLISQMGAAPQGGLYWSNTVSDGTTPFDRP